MGTLGGFLHGRVSLLATAILCNVVAILALLAASAEHKNSKTRIPSDEPGLPRSSGESRPDQTPSTPRWTLSVEGIAVQRLSGGVNRTLGSRLPGTVPFAATSFEPGIEVLNSNQIRQGLSAGPKIGLMHYNDSGYGVELSSFNVFDQRAVLSIGSESPADWLIMRAPGAFWQTQDFPYQSMTWSASTGIFSAEVNGRLQLSRRLTALAGIRWLQLSDKLQGSLTSTDQTADTRKTTCPGCALYQITPGGAVGALSPFWNTGTTNNLVGVQIGVDGKLLEVGRLSLDGRATIGLFDNYAEQSTGVSVRRAISPSRATTNGAAFVSEASLQFKYQVTDGLSLKAAYEALWFVGVALAPGQIDTTYAAPSDVRTLGVNRGSNTVFHGATLGLGYSF